MSTRTFGLDERIGAYIRAVVLKRDDEILARLRALTAKMPQAQIQISAEQGQIMGMLAATVGAKRALEIGVFTGYSALCVARKLPPNGRLVACDVSEEWTTIAQRFWDEAGVADRIDLRIAPASDTLANLIAGGESNTFDFAFIDADKEGYDGYYEQCLALLRSGGLVVLDNIFMDGQVVEPAVDDPGVSAVRKLTEKIFRDTRVDPSLIPISDGVIVARKN